MASFSWSLNKIRNFPPFFIEMGQTFINGQRVLASELKWLAVQAIRRLEIRQLEKLRQKEYALLGKFLNSRVRKEEDASHKKEIQLSKEQIHFLEKEISHLEQDLQDYREKLVSKRRAKWL